MKMLHALIKCFSRCVLLLCFGASSIEKEIVFNMKISEGWHSAMPVEMAECVIIASRTPAPLFAYMAIIISSSK